MASSRRSTPRSTPDASTVDDASAAKAVGEKTVAVNSVDPHCDQLDLEDVPECSICLQQCAHPVQLPCTHIFCYLCVKGVANQSKRCALCRQEIPQDFLYKPLLLRKEELENEAAFDGGYQWFYEGNRGWWQYDERASSEIEEQFKKEQKGFEMLIAGFLYVIDIENMIQYRRNDPTRRRRIKRDLINIPDRKGVAGLQCGSKKTLRKDGDGGEKKDGSVTLPPAPQPVPAPSHNAQPSDVAPPLPPRTYARPPRPSPRTSPSSTGTAGLVASADNGSPNAAEDNETPRRGADNASDSPGHSDLSQPHNTPQTPESQSDSEGDGEEKAGGSEGEDELTESGEDQASAVAVEMAGLRLTSSQDSGPRRGQLHIPSRSARTRHDMPGHNSRRRCLPESPSSSDSEWD